MLQQKRLLILSDGKPGHLNQSIAFARHLGCEYDVLPVAFRSRIAKGFSYFADRLRLRLEFLFTNKPISGSYGAVVSAGSETYYANRVLADKLSIKSIAIMLPKGYRYDFDLIVAQQHDDPPQQRNIISLPINLTYVDPQGLVQPEGGRKYVSVIIGGDSKQGVLEAGPLREQLRKVFELFPEHDFWVTTSRRTSASVEAVLREFSWNRAVYYSQEKINPIPDFLAHCEYVFLTADSTSMISEAVSYGQSCVEILSPAEEGKGGKFYRMMECLQEAGALRRFDGTLHSANKKIDLSQALQGSTL
ncbi:mitochondrial fission ELM1 family protein [Deltaproteobacteria bacterium]|nr:mitochondrial fission ELM1 family protein [Deltaproteobacteria bacterium]